VASLLGGLNFVVKLQEVEEQTEDSAYGLLSSVFSNLARTSAAFYPRMKWDEKSSNSWLDSTRQPRKQEERLFHNLIRSGETFIREFLVV
jgi:hypothetical protein